jgi:4-hydroxymandelate oxidase
MAANAEAWVRIRLRPHVLRDVSRVRTATTVLGAEASLPVLVAPLAYQRLAHPDGEAATAAGTAAAGTVMVVSTMATVSLEDVAAAAPDAVRWFQLYVHRDRQYTAELVTRAAGAGYQALVLTVDTPVLGHRPQEAGFRQPPLANRARPGQPVPVPEGMGTEAYATTHFDPTLTLRVLDWLAERSSLPIVVKGVLRGDDAAACVDAGAAAVVVSNHGGRQLDTALAGAEALPEVVAAVGGRAEVYVDGGVRRGTDVVKALALGARAVMVGRPVLWGLATGGAGGVRAVLDRLRAELVRAMALCGAPTVADLTADLVGSSPPRRDLRPFPG